MDRKIYRSKPFVAALLILFTALWAGEGFARTASQEQSEFTKAIQAGKKLYEDGEHKEAALKLLQALTFAKEKAEITEACFYLSLAYYGLGESANAQLYLKRLFEAEPDKEIDARLFPSGYVTLFYRTKSELAGQKPAKVEEKPKVEVKAEEEKKPTAVPGKAEPEVKKKGKFPWLIVGGLLVAAGVVLYLVLGKKKDSASTQGSISIVSTPAGAKVFLDGNDTGQTTACTLSNVTAGSHAVKLTKDGYADYQQNVTVTGGQTAAVNAAMTANIIVVTSPASNTTWTIGTTNDIRWQVDTSALAERLRANSVSRNRGKGGEVPGRSEIGIRPGENASTADRTGFAGRKRKELGESVVSADDPPLLSGAVPISQSSALGIVKVKIELFKAGSLHSLIVAETDNTGVYFWPASQPTASGSDYKIRVSCSTDSSIYGESATFTLVVGAIVVTSPAAGSFWGKGGTYDIRWTSASAGNVNIELYKGMSLFQTIASNAANSGFQSWTISSSLADGSDYKIRVSYTASPNTFGESGLFQIGIGSAYEFALKWGSPGTGDGLFNGPRGIAVDAAGYVYVADTDNNRIQKFTENGAFLANWGIAGTGDGQFKSPWGMTFDNSGFLYVIELNNARIQKFNSTGSFVSKFGTPGTGDGQFNAPRWLAVDASGNIYVSDQMNYRIQKFNSSGVFLTKWGNQGISDGQFNSPQGIAVDSSGNVYVAESDNCRIQKFNSNGAFLAKWGTPGSGDSQFSQLRGMAIDSAGNIYVADFNAARVQKFSSSGTFIAKWGSGGAGDGQFNNPSGIAVDSSGNVYVTEMSNNRVQKFRPKAGAPLFALFQRLFGPLASQGNRGIN